MELKGILKKVNAQVERGNFVSRKVWLTTDASGNYPQTIEIEVSGDKVNLFNNVNAGSEVNCSINLRGREWTNPKGEVVVFNTLQCWKIAVDGVTVAAPKAVEPDLNDTLPF